MILLARQRENSKRGFLEMKIKALFLLVITILTATGATIDTVQIDQLTGLKANSMKRKVPTKSVSPAKMSRFSSMVGRYRLSWDSAPGRIYQSHA